MRISWKKTALAVTLAVSGLSLAVSRARAANPAVLNIDVAITAAKSVTVNGVASSTNSASVTWSGVANASFTALNQSSATVQNNGVVTEGWELSTNPYTIDTVGSSSWQVVASTISLPGPNQVALQAVFGSSNTAAGGCPVVGSADWNSSEAAPITGSVNQYTSLLYADQSLNNGGGTPDPDNGSNQLYANSKRALCWKLIMPNSTSTQDTQNVQIIVTAL